MPDHCPPGCPDGASTKDAAAFNTHSPGGEGSGLAQHVFRSPARIPATEPSPKSTCAPAKRKTLCITRTKNFQLKVEVTSFMLIFLRRNSVTTKPNWRARINKASCV